MRRLVGLAFPAVVFVFGCATTSNSETISGTPSVFFVACDMNDKCDAGTFAPSNPNSVKIDTHDMPWLNDDAVANSFDGHWVVQAIGADTQKFPGMKVTKHPGYYAFYGQAGKGLVSWTTLGQDCQKESIMSWSPVFAKDGGVFMHCSNNSGLWVKKFKFGGNDSTPASKILSSKGEVGSARIENYSFSPDQSQIAYTGKKGTFLVKVGGKPAAIPGLMPVSDARILLTEKHLFYKTGVGAKRKLAVHDLATKKSQTVFDYTHDPSKHILPGAETNWVASEANNALYFMDTRGEMSGVGPIMRLDLKTMKTSKVFDCAHNIYGASPDGHYFLFGACSKGHPGISETNQVYGRPESPGLIGIYDMRANRPETMAWPKGVAKAYPSYLGFVK